MIALNHLSRKSECCSAREISETYGLPFEITAKTLQRLKETGWIKSSPGSRGGYQISFDPTQATLAKFLESFEGYQSVAMCCQPDCDAKPFMIRLNAKLFYFLNGIKMSELLEDPIAPVSQLLKPKEVGHA